MISGLNSSGTQDAPAICAVTRFRATLFLIARGLILTILATVVTVEATPGHVKCAAAKHRCGSTAAVVACCDMQATDATRGAGPIASVLRLAPPSACDAMLPRLQAPTCPCLLRAEGAPPTAVPPDIPILLSNLRE